MLVRRSGATPAGGLGGRHNNVTQYNMWQLSNHWIHWIRCIRASAPLRDLPPATRHFRTWIPLASRGARPEHVHSSRCGASWELSPLPPLPPASPSLLFLLPSPSSIPAPALRNHGRRRDQLHLGGAAPLFALGGRLFLITLLRCFFQSQAGITVQSLWGLLWASWKPLGGFLRPPGGLFGASWGPLWGLLGSLGGVLGRLGALLRRLAPSEAVMGASRGRLGALWGSSWAVLGARWTVLGASLGRLGALLGRLGALLGASWAVLGPFWRLLGPS